MAGDTMQVGDGITAGTARWSFGGDTPAHFEEHVRRSVPFYDEGHELVEQISDFFVKADSTCYELGASTGALVGRLAARHLPSVRWIGVDIEPRMTEAAKARAAAKSLTNVAFVTEDIGLLEIEPSDLIVSYYTIQFIPPRLRQEVIDRVYRSLHWGGGFLMFEKVRGADARFQDLLTGLYTDFKVKQGYSPEEILGKSKSLRGVLEPFSTQGNLDLLRRAGFVDVMTVFRYLCFEGYLCIK